MPKGRNNCGERFTLRQKKSSPPLTIESDDLGVLCAEQRWRNVVVVQMSALADNIFLSVRVFRSLARSRFALRVSPKPPAHAAPGANRMSPQEGHTHANSRRVVRIGYLLGSSWRAL